MQKNKICAVSRKGLRTLPQCVKNQGNFEKNSMFATHFEVSQDTLMYRKTQVEKH